MYLQSGCYLQDGKYQIENVLGQGGFGITYLATQVMLGCKVAIKEFFFKQYCDRDCETGTVRLGTSEGREIVEKFLAKFMKEAQTIYKLRHPNIVRVTDCLRENGTAYYVMDYIDGESLSDKVKRLGKIPEQEAIEYIRQVAIALSYIHERHINHLDIKPGNIMQRSLDGGIVLIDFGVSKLYDADTMEGTTTTPVGISAGYSPIEQYRKAGMKKFSPQSDIYALGATLYKLLTGKTPPEAVEMPSEGMEQLVKELSPLCQRIIVKAMQHRKQDRPQNMKAFLELLKEPNSGKQRYAILLCLLVVIVLGVAILLPSHNDIPHVFQPSLCSRADSIVLSVKPQLVDGDENISDTCLAKLVEARECYDMALSEYEPNDVLYGKCVRQKQLLDTLIALLDSCAVEEKNVEEARLLLFPIMEQEAKERLFKFRAKAKSTIEKI